MNAQAFRHFYDYHFSENRKLWDRYVSQLSDEQFSQQATYSHGSVRDQFVHLMSVDEVWFSELRGVEPSELTSSANLADRDVIRTHWDKLEQHMREYLAALRDEMLFDTPIEEPDEDRDLNGSPQGGGDRRHGGRPLQGHRRPSDQPDDQDHQHRGIADPG